jgi:hypothetical protein
MLLLLAPVLCREEVSTLHPLPPLLLLLLLLLHLRICHVLAAFSTMKLSDVTFWRSTEHDLSKEMLRLISYEFCSEVQTTTLEPVLGGKDV